MAGSLAKCKKSQGPLMPVVLFLCILGWVLLRGVIIHIPGQKRTSSVTLGTLKVHLGHTFKITLSSSLGPQTILSGDVGKELPADATFQIHTETNIVEVEWPSYAKMSIQYKPRNGLKCYDIHWQELEGGILLGGSSKLMDCYDMRKAHWYGAAQVFEQLWPIEKWSRSLTAFVTGDSYRDKLGGVQERYFLSSQGVALHVHEDVPLFVSMNSSGNQLLCLAAMVSYPYKPANYKRNFLKYTLCQDKHVQSLHSKVVGKFFDKPSDIPDQRVFRYPIWSTWAKYKKSVNQTKVLQFAKDIRKYKFKDCQLEIDDDWTPRYGDLEFDPVKFPNPKQMVDQLKAWGFRVTLWVHPFASVFSQAVIDGNHKHYWVRNKVGYTAYVIWWDGIGAMLDVTNPAAVKWFKDKLKNLQIKYGVDSFKFDGGEGYWLPWWYRTYNHIESPNKYTEILSQIAHETDPTVRCQEVRVGHRSQHLPLFVRLMDKESVWGYENGLKSLIPHVLTFGILGYPFVLPDMVGGNAYKGIFFGTAYPKRELFIRWLEASVFFPVLQFSVTPWQYDNEVVRITHKMVNLHEKYADKIIALAHQSVQTGAPIVRPLWWIAPNDEDALVIDSEFLLGNDTLVAPVLDEGARSRHIYLPEGKWLDELRQRPLLGNRWYYNYTAKLDELPYFTKLNS